MNTIKRHLVCFCFGIAFSLNLCAQETVRASIEHDNIERNYTLYVPASYDGSAAYPLVFNFHGYTSTSEQQMLYGDFRTIADTAHFLLVHPMGTEDDMGITHFNAEWGTGVDDIGFTAALIDSLSAGYNINADRIYSTGMSNGGFMSYTLACNLSDRFAAIASVTGTMTVNQLNTCSATRAVPIMEIHGTDDGTVPYNGNTWMAPVDDVIDYWVEHNACDETAIFTEIEDSNTSDGSTVERYEYINGDDNSTVELLKIIDGGHTWPGTLIVFGSTNLDINASEKVWQFFAKYDRNGLISSLKEEPLVESNNVLRLSPNVTSDYMTLNWNQKSFGTFDLKIIRADGKLVHKNQEFVNGQTLDVSHLKKGSYFIHGVIEDKTQVVKFIKI